MKFDNMDEIETIILVGEFGTIWMKCIAWLKSNNMAEMMNLDDLDDMGWDDHNEWNLWCTRNWLHGWIFNVNEIDCMDEVGPYG